MCEGPTIACAPYCVQDVDNWPLTLIRHHRTQQDLQVPQPTRHRLPVEQRRAVRQCSLQAFGGLFERQRQIKVRALVRQGLW